MPLQKNPDELIGILNAEYQPRAEPNFALAKAISTFLALPGLRGFWPMSSIDYTQPECTDISVHGNHLQAAAALGNVKFGYDELAPIANFAGGANQYLSKADGGAGNWADILGTETQIIASQRGLSLGGWFWWSALPGVSHYLMVKDTIALRQYQLVLTVANTLRMAVWPGAILIDSVATINAGWNHCAGIYDAQNQDLHVVLNGVTTSNLGAAPAALADTAAPFTVGADGAGTNRFTGYASMCLLCAASLSSSLIENHYQQTRTLYNV